MNGRFVYTAAEHACGGKAAWAIVFRTFSCQTAGKSCLKLRFAVTQRNISVARHASKVCWRTLSWQARSSLYVRQGEHLQHSTSSHTSHDAFRHRHLFGREVENSREDLQTPPCHDLLRRAARCPPCFFLSPLITSAVIAEPIVSVAP